MSPGSKADNETYTYLKWLHCVGALIHLYESFRFDSHDFMGMIKKKRQSIQQRSYDIRYYRYQGTKGLMKIFLKIQRKRKKVFTVHQFRSDRGVCSVYSINYSGISFLRVLIHMCRALNQLSNYN